jgi:hypothetical protein
VFLFCTKESPTTVAQKHLWGAITGQVNDTKGRPLPGVQVTAGTVMALSDSAGFFVLDKVAPASYTLKVQFADYDAVKTYSAQVSAYGDSVVLQEPIQMTSRYYLLKGKIVQSSAPVPLAGVMVADQAITGLTNNAGVYILSKVSKDSSLQIISAKTGVGCAKLEGLRGIADDTTFIPNLSLQDQGGTITGTVYDTLNRPVAKAQVLALAGGLADTASSSGQYMLTNVPASEASLRIYVPDTINGLVGAISGVSVNEGKTVMGADIYLRPATSFTNNMMVQASDMVVADTAKTIAIPVLGLTTGSTRIASYQWYTTGGANPDTTTQNASLSIAPKTGSSSMNIAVRAISDSGLYSARTSITVKILSTKPVVQATVCSATDTVQRDSVTILQNDMAQFRGSAIAPFGGVDTMEWIFGDGSQWIASDTSANVGHSYDTNGTFKAVLKVRDAVGNIVCDTLKIIVQKPLIPAPSYGYPNNNDKIKTASDSVKLVWHAVSGTAIKYNVYLSWQNNPPGSGDKIVSLIADTSANVVVVPGKRYYWYVETVSSNANQKGIVWNFVVISGAPNNHPPVFVVTSADTLNGATVGKPYRDTVSATDTDGDTVRYSFIDSAVGMSVGALSGIIQWTPIIADTGKHTVSVLAKDGKGGLDTLTWTIAVSAGVLTVPVLVSPANAASGEQTSLTLSWNSVTGATSYCVEASTDSAAFSSPVLLDSTVTGTTRPINGVAFNTKYFWRVRAKSASGSTAWSGVWSFTTIAQAAVLYVNAAATGANTGNTWGDAFTSLQTALDSAKANTQIWVAAGTYKPTKQQGGIGPRYQSFSLKTAVAVYGGFAGKETQLSQRDWKSNVTICSGDIGVAGDSTDNCYHVFYHTLTMQIDNRSVLDGFTITEGNANGAADPDDQGGGLYNTSARPTINNCVITSNYGGSGGGMYNTNASAVQMYNCTVSNNACPSGSGGGISNASSNIVVIRCMILSNASGFWGGGINNSSSSPSIDSSIVSNNQSNQGAIYNDGASNLRIANSTISANNCLYYGAVFSAGNINIANCVFQNNVTSSSGGGAVSISGGKGLISNSTFVSNEATADGGAIFCQPGTLVSLSLVNCTFSSNTAIGNGGGIYYVSNYPTDSSKSIINCIFWNDYSGSGSNEIYTGQSFPLVIKNTVVQNGYSDTMAIMTNIVTDDPQLGVLADNGGPVQTMALGSGSSAIDKGLYVYQDNNGVFCSTDGSASYLDLLGKPYTPVGTVTQLNATDARGVTRPQGAGIDLGAYEK